MYLLYTINIENIFFQQFNIEYSIHTFVIPRLIYLLINYIVTFL